MSDAEDFSKWEGQLGPGFKRIEPFVEHDADDVFARLTPEERATRIKAATDRLKEMELEAIARGDTLPDDLPQPDTFGVWDVMPDIYFPPGWENLDEEL